MEKLTLGSLFDGSGGFPLGGIMAGIEPLWASEIEPFPVRVTSKRIPSMKHYGDVSKINGAEVPPVDILTFGSPCQDMSVAGKRAGLEGERSGLFHQAIRIVKEMRRATNGKKPRYLVWENVPGAFSSNGGDDFKAVIDEICRVKDETVDVPKPNKWQNAGLIMGADYSVAWRVFDAQYWGVPQRRRRIFLVASLGDKRAGEILFNSEGLSWNSAESIRPWERITETVERCIDKTSDIEGKNNIDAVALENHPADSRVTILEDGKVQTLTSRMGTGGGNVPLILKNASESNNAKDECGLSWDGGQISPTLTKQNAGGNQRMPDKDNFNCVLQRVNAPNTFDICESRCNELVVQKSAAPTAFGVCSKESNSMKSDNPNSGFYEAKTSRTLDTKGSDPTCAQGGMAVVALEGNDSRPSHQGCGYSEDGVGFTLNATEHHAVAYGIDRAAFNQGRNAQYGFAVEKEIEPTLLAKGPGAVAHTLTSSETVLPYYIVRRLTPTECARLQGFPDWWCADLKTEDPTEEDLAFWREVFDTQSRIMNIKKKSDSQIIKWLKDPHTDGAEYKMWGNGVALPNVYYVLSGIAYWATTEDEPDLAWVNDYKEEDEWEQISIFETA